MAEEDLRGEWKKLARRVDDYRSSLPPEEPEQEQEQEPQKVSAGKASQMAKLASVHSVLAAGSGLVSIAAGGASNNWQIIDIEIKALQDQIAVLHAEIAERDEKANHRIDLVLKSVDYGRKAVLSLAVALAGAMVSGVAILMAHRFF